MHLLIGMSWTINTKPLKNAPYTLHLRMGKSILVSYYLSVQKVTSLYWEECRLDSLVTYATFGRTKMDV